MNPQSRRSDEARRPSVIGFPADRLPPQSVEAEEGVLGAILLDNDVLADVMATLQPEDFWRSDHAVVFRAMRDLHDAGDPVDALTLMDAMERTGDLERVGGFDGITAFANRVPHAANAKYHAAIVRDRAVKRRAIAAATEIIERGYSPETTAADLVTLAEEKVFAIGQSARPSDLVMLGAAADLAMARMQRRRDDEVSGLKTGLRDLDFLTDGLVPTNLIVLAARPSMGKSALILNVAERVALDQGVGVLFVSQEMSALELADRSLSSRSGVDGMKIRTGRVSPNDIRDIGKAAESFRALGNFWIDDTPGRTVSQIASTARRLKAQHDIGLIVVDYIQLLDSDRSDGRENRQDQVARISRGLKKLAGELSVPVVALSQLNRKAEDRSDNRPKMSDLRESGAIEQDANIVLLLHRPDYYDKADRPGVAECIVAKNRNGPVGTVELMFNKPLMRFENLSREPDFDRI